ncbi:hypothetical protein ACFQXA_09985 [Nocardiopsis composta]
MRSARSASSPWVSAPRAVSTAGVSARSAAPAKKASCSRPPGRGPAVALAAARAVRWSGGRRSAQARGHPSAPSRARARSRPR